MSDWHEASGIVSLLAALCLSIVVLNRDIHEGLIIKAGLIGLIMSLLTTFALTMNDSRDWEAYWRASFVTRCSLLIVGLGLLWRARKYGNLLRKSPHYPTCRSLNLWGWIKHDFTQPGRDLAAMLHQDGDPPPQNTERRK